MEEDKRYFKTTNCPKYNELLEAYTELISKYTPNPKCDDFDVVLELLKNPPIDTNTFVSSFLDLEKNYRKEVTYEIVEKNIVPYIKYSRFIGNVFTFNVQESIKTTPEIINLLSNTDWGKSQDDAINVSISTAELNMMGEYLNYLETKPPEFVRPTKYDPNTPIGSPWEIEYCDKIIKKSNIFLHDMILAVHLFDITSLSELITLKFAELLSSMKDPIYIRLVLTQICDFTTEEATKIAENERWMLDANVIND
jgi:hypothetical protein